MRIILLLLFLSPLLLKAQVNRSATELARERIQEYIETKLFKEKPYKTISYGQLKPYNQVRSETAWTIEHNFEIMENKLIRDKKVPVATPYRFFFYLDRKIKVLGAENIQSY